MTIEIAVQDVDGARIALEEGADRIELCAALECGGLTPSFGMIQACAHVGVPMGVQVLIRSRAGSFVFDEAEKLVQIADVRSAILAGASGVVVGGMTAEGGIDEPFARALVEAARDEAVRCNRKVKIVFHRAFDMLDDPFAGLETLVELGFDRVLTSGGAPDAPSGLETLRALAERSAGRIEIEAGGGVTVDSIPTLLSAGVSAVHLSAKARVTSDGGPGGGGDGDIFRTDRQTVRKAVSAAHRA
ncbi:copper homeostasis protein CutC [Bifidobacterium leontopitheci]|uniref:PF03932 family protein CutC n=1 Tax=Bifidobacterium leontopitheci TaxID=2650774 RepID=A0A6I1GI48_9BIFI|nr:copper homeostasis protein CutC [Bifidobacterium leontopitheci]KAB7791333.1 copper homeostasis protein [Bifidobacterium leontopitheci]